MPHFTRFAGFHFFAFLLIFSTAAVAQLATRPQRAAANIEPVETETNQSKRTARQTPAKFSNEILSAQIVLTNRNISCGALDGLAGEQTGVALRVFQQLEKLPASGRLDAATKARLKLPGAPPLRDYVFTQEDAARLNSLPKTWLEKSVAERLDYETALELVAEQNFSNPKLIRQLNPQINWNQPLGVGTSVRVPDVKPPAAQEKAALIKISLSGKTLQVFGADKNLLAHYPSSIGARVEKRPVGELEVVNLAVNPNYTFDPVNFPESEEARALAGRKLILPPGANNPVGLAWIGLNLPGYGIHGTPAPEQVGRTESHGCFRLANWDVLRLVRLVKTGTPVVVEK